MASLRNFLETYRTSGRSVLGVGLDLACASYRWRFGEQSESTCRELLRSYPRWIQGHVLVAQYLLDKPGGAPGAYFCARCAKELLDSLPAMVRSWLSGIAQRADLLVARSLTAQGHWRIAIQLLEAQLQGSRTFSKRLSIDFVEALVAAHVGAGEIARAQEVVARYQLVIDDPVVIERLRWVTHKSQGGELV